MMTHVCERESEIERERERERERVDDIKNRKCFEKVSSCF